MKRTIEYIGGDNDSFGSPNADYLVAEILEASTAEQGRIGEAEQNALVELSGEINDSERRLEVLGLLAARVEVESVGLTTELEKLEDHTIGFGVAEIDLSRVPKLLDRLASGKNPAFVVRGSDHNNFARVSSTIESHTGKRTIHKTEFPSSGMGSASSALHLDNFVDGRNPGFRYALSASEIVKGGVLFIAGSASNPALKIDKANYENRWDKINSNALVRKAYDAAEQLPIEKMHTQTIKIDEAGTTLHTVPLTAGDVAVWPQGADGFPRASWHCFRQVGDQSRPDFEPRKSISYHYV